MSNVGHTQLGKEMYQRVYSNARTELLFWLLKGHSQLWDRADLDTSFVSFEKHLPQPEIKAKSSRY